MDLNFSAAQVFAAQAGAGGGGGAAPDRVFGKWRLGHGTRKWCKARETHAMLKIGGIIQLPSGAAHARSALAAGQVAP